jgi:hypothetical protein
MESTPGAAATGFYLSINLHRLGRTEQANQAFDRAARAMAELPSAGEGDLGESGIENWLIAHVAHREATRILHPENDK